MQVVARPDWDAIEWATPLARTHARGALPAALSPPRTPVPTSAPRESPDWDALRAEAGAGSTEAWDVLALPEAGAVVTGQQPGCIGGPLLVLYKIATAVALAARLAREHGRPVVPVFWNAADDDDFAEVATVGWLAGDGRLDFVELPRNGHHGWVGDLPAAHDIAAAEAVLHSDAAAHGGWIASGAADHGHWVSAFVTRVFPQVAVVDGRSAALRRAAAPLFMRYLDARDRVTAAVEAQIAQVRAAGFAPALVPASLRAGLHLTAGRRRVKPGDDWAPVRTALETAPETVSPNVVLRALVQDTLLPTWAQVVGPAELAYSIELRPARALLGVPEPALVPRLTATLVPDAMWSEVATWDPAVWLHDPAAAIARAGRAEPDHALDAALAAAIDAVRKAGAMPSALERAVRRIEGVRDDVAAARDEAARATWIAAHPALRGLASWVRPRGKPQERVVAGLWLASRRGPALGRELAALADLHLDALASGPVHPVVTIGDPE